MYLVRKSPVRLLWGHKKMTSLKKMGLSPPPKSLKSHSAISPTPPSVSKYVVRAKISMTNYEFDFKKHENYLKTLKTKNNESYGKTKIKKDLILLF